MTFCSISPFAQSAASILRILPSKPVATSSARNALKSEPLLAHENVPIVTVPSVLEMS